MTDLPTRLRDQQFATATTLEAAAEIERLKREAEISAQSLRNVQSVREHEHKRAEAALAEIERLTALLEVGQKNNDLPTRLRLHIPIITDEQRDGAHEVMKISADEIERLTTLLNLAAEDISMVADFMEGQASENLIIGPCFNTPRLRATLARIKEPRNDQ